ncbi:fibrobacter succinogenes major paralogous domain-containing protein [Echinicola rosea]|uniref:fibrobacter succinogenes major paralogous domain-containing protein n=1 Tax=Echinicola rosea TaxID=1807691 RepID=UPI0010CA8CB6|nr:fibrobacter succinogenes major paralogous domain-containing protein [Echinicola rosea]
MKHYSPITYCCILLILAASCVQESIEDPNSGMVSFSELQIDFGHDLPNSRIAETSSWNHIFLNRWDTLFITNKSTGEEYKLAYLPRDFSEAYQIQLPYGKYEFEAEVPGDKYEDYLPFRIEGEFTLEATNMDISMLGNTDYGLVTVKDEFVKSAYINGDQNYDLEYARGFFYAYVKKDQTITITIKDFFQDNPLEKVVQVHKHNHYNFYLQVNETDEGEVNFIELAIGPFEYSEEFIEVDGKTVTDAAGNRYPIVKIGEQYWMAENLKSDVFCNGDSLLVPEDTYIQGYVEQNVPLVLFAGYHPAGDRGGYYTGDVILDERNICPCDWHISTDEDWKEMEAYLGMPAEELDIFRTTLGGQFRGITQGVGSKIKATNWPYSTNNTDANNLSGFSAYGFNNYCCSEEPPGSTKGYYVYIDDGGGLGLWWSPKSSGEDAMIGRVVSDTDSGIGRVQFYREIPSNIRCVKD